MAENKLVTQVITQISGVMGPYLKTGRGHLVVTFFIKFSSEIMLQILCLVLTYILPLRWRLPHLATGEFHRQECMFKTLSDAINIQVPYNMERIFYYLTGTWHGLICWDFCLICLVCLTHWHIYVFLKVGFT